MSLGNSNAHMRRRIKDLEATVSQAYTALHAAAPLMNALLAYYRANEACQPDPDNAETATQVNAKAEAFLKARREVIAVIESSTVGSVPVQD